MNYLVVLIVDDPDHCPAILNAWEEAGVSGVTILESSGLGRLRQGGLMDDLPLMPSLSDTGRRRGTPPDTDDRSQGRGDGRPPGRHRRTHHRQPG